MISVLDHEMMMISVLDHEMMMMSVLDHEMMMISVLDHEMMMISVLDHEMMMISVLDQHNRFDFYSARSLKHQSRDRCVAPLRHIILTPTNQSLFSLLNTACLVEK